MILILGMLYYATSLFDGLSYEKVNTVIKEKPEEIHTLLIEPEAAGVRIENGFSFAVLYGFEETSLMAERENALCAINGMFYEDFGLPMGMVVHDGVPTLSYDIGTPTVIIDKNGDIGIEDVDMFLYAKDNSGQVELFGVNGRVPNGEWGVFTSLYGSTTRIRRDSTNYLITEGEVVDVIRTNSPVSVKESDYVLSYAGFDYRYTVGDKVEIVMDVRMEDSDGHEITENQEIMIEIHEAAESQIAMAEMSEKSELDLTSIEEAFQTGGWLVKDGINVASDYETFIGYTTAAQPRTMVGLKEDGAVMFVVVDGRDMDRSRGLSGKEAADLMIDKGCIDAAYLDGGASSTMVIDGKIVNQPAYDGERAIAHSILIHVDK